MQRRFYFFFSLISILGIGAFSFWITQTQNPPVIIAILDTGINLDLIPSKNRMITLSLENQTDENGHGTRIASMILSLTQKSKILPIKIQQEGQPITAQSLSQGIKQAVQSGAKIINISLGTSETSSDLETIIQTATEKGVLIVAAAGSGLNNPFEPMPIAQVFPQAFSQVWVIGTLLDWNQALHPERSENFGRQIDLSVLPPFESGFLQDNKNAIGSSYAAAYITGLLAKRIEEDSTLKTYSSDTLRMMLRNTSQPLPYYLKWSEEQDQEPRGGYGVFNLSQQPKIIENLQPISHFSCRLYSQPEQDTEVILHLNTDLSIKNLTYSKVCAQKNIQTEIIESKSHPELQKGLVEIKLNLDPMNLCSLTLTIDTSKNEAQDLQQFEISFPSSGPTSRKCIANEIRVH